MRTLAIANITEFNRNNVRGSYAPSELEMWRRAGDELADMAAFWGGDDTILLAPSGSSAGWAAHVRRQLDCALTIVTPRATTGRLLEDSLLDVETMTRLVALGADGLVLEPWGCTPGVLRLDAALRAAGVTTTVNAPPASALWTVGYLESKLVLHDLAGRTTGLRVPRSYTATTIEQLLGLAAALSSRGEAFVVKSHIGVSGFGSYVSAAAEGRGRSAETDVPELVAAIGEEPIFREGPYLVQEWVASGDATLRPTFDGIVTDDGVEPVGVGGMIIDGVHYNGVVVGDVPLPSEVLGAAGDAGTMIGEHARSLGFRGWFDVDFVLSDAGEIWATEVNARKTSPTHAFRTLERWSARDPRIRCVVAHDHLPTEAGWADVEAILAAAERDGVRCAVSIGRTLGAPDGAVGVVIGASGHEAAHDILREVRTALAER
jgi:hypothetical protein